MKMFRVFFVLGICLSLINCQASRKHVIPTNEPAFVELPSATIIQSSVTIEDLVILQKDITVYPGVQIRTTGNGKLVLNGRLHVIGHGAVFHPDANISFGPGSTGTLNVAWFGANGIDNIDDSHAFAKTFEVASVMENSVNIYVPVGKYRISEQLVLENKHPKRKTINLIGEAMSNSTNHGSSLIWMGVRDTSMIIMRNNFLCLIQSLDFAVDPGYTLKYNVELKPYIYQVELRDCSFSGCSGPYSSNVSLNAGGSKQVSEIRFDNCVFHSKTTDNITWTTHSAIAGGLANTKNFFIGQCSFLGYTEAAVNIGNSAILDVRNSTFAHNKIDISCALGGAFISSNYSERSGSFFRTMTTSNQSFSTLVNNYFDGHEEEDFVITNGVGSLVLLNNYFGGTGGVDSLNLIRWSYRNISSIFSVGNFFRNDSTTYPFVHSGINAEDLPTLSTFGDKVGESGKDAKKIDHNLPKH